MKRLLLLPLLLGAQLAIAQLVTSPSTAIVDGKIQGSVYTQLVDSMTAPLNKSRVPYGILYDRVMPYAHLHQFTQATTSSATHLLQSYFELRSAAFTNYGLPYHREAYREQVEIEAAPDENGQTFLPIGVLDYRFGVIDTLAEEKRSIVQINGLYADGPVGNPYETRQVTLASFMFDSVNQTTAFKLPYSLLLNNTRRGVKSVVITVAGKTVAMVPGETKPFFFWERGLLPVNFQITFTDNSTVSAKSQIYVKPTLQRRATEYRAENPYHVYGNSWKDYFGKSTFGHGEVRQYMFNNQSIADHKLRRPIIILDGFDPGNKRDLDELFEAFKSVGEGLQGVGQARDLVILNFPVSKRLLLPDNKLRWVDGGADYIERNALVLVELLNQLKSDMANPNEKITIVGPSMGGLISRYALALMEKNYADASNSATYQKAYWKHNVDTWLSFDAPHQGANIPMGDQAFVNYFAGASEGAANALGRLNSVAARQMLVHQWENMSSSISIHEPFMRALQNNGLPGSYGYPTQVRRVAIANGDGSGALNSLMGEPGGIALQLDVTGRVGYERRRFFFRDTSLGTQVAADIRFTGPANVRTTVFQAQARLWISMVKNIQRKFKVDFTTPVNYDLAPGGFYDAQQEIIKGSREKADPLMYYNFYNVKPNHNFIPTVSALAFQYRTLTNYQSIQQLPNPYTNLQQRDLICNGETPFDAYYVHDKINTYHVTFEEQSAKQFLFRELVGQTQPVRFKVAAKEICPKSTLTLGLDECQRTGTVTYNWSVSGPAVFSNGTTQASNGGLNQNVRSTGAQGTVVVSVTATRTGAAPSPAGTYSFTVRTSGEPLQPQIVLEEGQRRICPYSTVDVMAVGVSSGPYYWTRRTTNSYTGQVTTYSYTTSSPKTSVLLRYDDVSLSVTAPSVCSGVMLPVGEVYISPDVTDGKFCDPYGYAIYPVPSDQYMRITTVSEKESPTERAAKVNGPEEANPHAFQVTVYNDRGKKVKADQTKNGEVNVDTSTLPSGLYHVQMRRGGQTVNRNVNIQH